MKQMKDSGFPWLGEIPEHWEIGRVKFYYDFDTGFTPDSKNPDYYDNVDGYDWITIGDLTGDRLIPVTTETKISDIYVKEYNPKNVKAGSLLYSFKLSVGQVAFADRDIYTNEAIASFKEKENCNLKFLYYSSSLIINNANENIYGAKLLNQQLIRNAFIVFPPREEQEQIAEYLDEKCEIINNTILKHQDIIEKLEELKKSITTNIVTKGFNHNVLLKESNIPEIGKVPDNYVVLPFKYLLSNEDNNLKVGPFGSSLPSKEFVSDGFWVYTQRTVLDENYNSNDTCVNFDTYKRLEGFKVYPHDMLITTRGTIGKVSVVPDDAPLGILHPCIIRFKIDENKMLQSFLKYFINSTDLLLDQVKRVSESTTIEALYSYNLKSIFVVMPPLEEQKKIVSLLDKKHKEINNTISHHRNIINNLNEYRKSLIYHAVTGKIDCRKDIENTN